MKRGFLGVAAIIGGVVAFAVIAAIIMSAFSSLSASSDAAWNQTLSATENATNSTHSPWYFFITNTPATAVAKCYNMSDPTQTFTSKLANSSTINVSGFASEENIGCDYSYTQHVSGGSAEGIYNLAYVILVVCILGAALVLYKMLSG